MNRNCIFCDIIEGKSPADFIFEDEDLVIFKDIHPHAPIHLLIVPKKHIRSINDLSAQDDGIISKMIMAARTAARDLKTADSGYKLLFNVERGGGQLIFHLHLHLLGGWR